MRLDIEIDGWHLYGVSSDVLQDLGIAHTIVDTPSGEGDNDIKISKPIQSTVYAITIMVRTM